MQAENHNPQNNSIKNFAKEALHDLAHFDTKIFKTLKPLITKPGFLTNEAFTPAQNNYVKPLALFVFLNFLFFIVKSKGLFQYSLDSYNAENFFRQSIAEHIAASHLPAAIFAERFNTSMKFEQQEYVIIMLPLFALLMQRLYFKSKKYFVEHLIFSLHFYAFAVLFLMVMPYILIGVYYIVRLTGSNLSVLDSDAGLGTFLFLVTAIYLFIALKRVYTQNIFLTAFKTLLATSWFIFLIVFVYRYFLFYVVMHSVSE